MDFSMSSLHVAHNPDWRPRTLNGFAAQQPSDAYIHRPQKDKL